MSKPTKKPADEPAQNSNKLSRKERKKLEYIQYAIEKKEQLKYEQDLKGEAEPAKESAESTADAASATKKKTEPVKKELTPIEVRPASHPRWRFGLCSWPPNFRA